MRTRTVAAVVVVLTLVAYWLIPNARERKEADARKKLAFESLVERLPKGKPFSPTRPLSAEAKKRWASESNERTQSAEMVRISKRAEVRRARLLAVIAAMGAALDET